MIFQPSWFILYFIFSINSIVFYEIFYNDVTASRDVTYLFTDPNKICTAYVKLNSKHILFVREFFDLRYIFRDNYDYIVIHTIIYIYISPHLRGGSGTRSPLIFWDTFLRYLRVLLHPKKRK